MKKLPLLLAGLCLAGVLRAQSAPAAAPAKDDRLEESWFGPGPFAWHANEDDNFDYLWVKPGFSFAGKKVEIAADPVKMLGTAQREPDEVKLAGKISAALPAAWQKCFKKYWKGATVVPAGQGDLVLTYRVVDAMEPAGFGAWSFGQVAYDMKLTDKASGELLMALHNNFLAGRNSVGDTAEDVVEFCEVAADPAKAYTENPKTEEEIEAAEKKDD